MGIQESYNRVAGKIQTQADLISQIRAALAEKAAGVGGVELPDIAEVDLGAASDMAEGKQLIDTDGNIVTGEVVTVDEGKSREASFKSVFCNKSNGVPVQIGVRGVFSTARLFRPGAYADVNAPVSNFGDATPADVRAGVTFTSKSGLKIPGELEVGVQLPDIDDSVLGSASDLVEGKKLITPDGTVVTGEIPKRTSSDLTASGITVTAPAGYYASEAKKTVTVPTETKTVTSNGTYTPSSGKYFSSFTVNVPPSGITPSGTLDILENGTFDVTQYASAKVSVPTGGGSGGGYVIKTGTTAINSNVIDTGLSDIEQFFIYKKSHAAAGLIMLHYNKTNGISRLYSTQWTSYSKNAYSGTDGATVSGGTVTIESTTPSTGGVSSNVSYTWVAIGTE